MGRDGWRKRETEREREDIYICQVITEMAGDKRIRWQVNGLSLAGDTMTELMHLITDVTLADQRINTTGTNGLSWAGDNDRSQIKGLTGWWQEINGLSLAGDTMTELG